jgi:hypothetical protein
MYHDRKAWRCAFLWAKNMEAKDIHKEMLPIWAWNALYVLVEPGRLLCVSVIVMGYP